MSARQTNTRSDSGFSFIELLAYMAIAALLILAAVPQFAHYRSKAVVANLRDDVRSIAAAVEGQYSEASGYPTEGEVRSETGATLTVAGDPARLSSADTVLTYEVRDGEAFALTATNPAAPGVYVNWDSAAGGLQATTSTAIAEGAPVNGQRNLLTNGDMEDGPGGLWPNIANGIGSSARSEAAAHSGAYGWRLVRDDLYSYLELETVPVAPNTTYTLSAYVRSSSASTIHLTDRTDGFRTTSRPVSASWTRINYSFTTGADQHIYYGAVGAESEDGVHGSVFDIDDVMLNLGPTPAAFTVK